MAELERDVRSFYGFQDWQMDKSPESLKALGEWFAKVVKTRPRTAEEIEKIRSQNRIEFVIEPEQLDFFTLSRAFDIGIYLGEVMRTSYPVLKWEQDLKNRGMFGFGQLVISGFKNGIPMNTIHVSTVVADQLVERRCGKERLFELIQIYSKYL